MIVAIPMDFGLSMCWYGDFCDCFFSSEKRVPSGNKMRLVGELSSWRQACRAVSMSLSLEDPLGDCVFFVVDFRSRKGHPATYAVKPASGRLHRSCFFRKNLIKFVPTNPAPPVTKILFLLFDISTKYIFEIIKSI